MASLRLNNQEGEIMGFVALVVALFVEQALSVKVHARWHGLPAVWVAWCAQRLSSRGTFGAWWSWCLMVIAPALVVMLVDQLLGQLWGLFAWLWQIAVMAAALGFGQFAKRSAQLREAVELNDREAALQALSVWSWRGASQVVDWRARALGAAMVAAHRQVLAIVSAALVGWLLGSAVFGVVVYAMASAVRQADATEALQGGRLAEVAHTAWRWIEGLAVRITVLSLALTGSFERVLVAWRENSTGDATAHDRLLLSATGAALDLDDAVWDEALGDLPTADVSAVGLIHFSALDQLVWRSLSTGLAVFALLALVRWL